VIIGDAGATAGATSTNNFVYPDAFSLRELFVSDDDSSSNTVKWSYYHSITDNVLTPGTASPRHRIRINQVTPLTFTEAFGGTLGAAVPPSAKQIQSNDTDVDSVDSLAYTVTFRNLDAVNIDPAFPGVNRERLDQTTVLLFASDGTSFTQTSLTVYTDANTTDSLTGLASLVEVKGLTDLTVSANVTGWTSFNLGGILTNFTGGATITAGANGLCLTVNAGGNNFVEWRSPGDFFQLTKDQIYRARFTVTSDQSGVNAIPVWFLNWFNNDPGGFGIVYGGEFFFVDVGGGASAPGRFGNSAYHLYLAPPSTGTLQWNGDLPGGNPDNALSVFAPGSAGLDLVTLMFRIIDVANLDVAPNGSQDPIVSRNDSGTLCITSVRVDSVGLSALKNNVAENAYTAVFDPAVFEVADVLFGTNQSGAFQGGTIVVNMPNTPGPRTTQGVGDVQFFRLAHNVASEPATILGGALPNPAKFFPIVHVDDGLYLARTRIRNSVAGTASGGTIDPIDVIIFNITNPTFEVGGKHFVSRAAVGSALDRASSPRHPNDTGGVTQEFIGIFFTHKASIGDVNNDGVGDPTLFPNPNSLRVLVDFFNADFIGTATTGPDGIPGVGASGADDAIVENLVVDRLNLPSGH